MSKTYILYNPLAGGGQGKAAMEPLTNTYPEAETVDMHGIDSYRSFFDSIDASDRVIICGGDGTLNRFANDIKDLTIRNELYLFPVGSGNDFARDLDSKSSEDGTFHINAYVKNLPRVTVNDKEYAFLNGVGFGIDGYCCEVGDAQREQNRQNNTDKPINYTAIAIKGLLFHYKPTNATVTVDGVVHTFKKVWIAPTMNGRFYGGGMMPTPHQDRLNKDKTVSVMLMHGTGKLKTLMIFPSLFKGEHVKHQKHVTTFSGHDITVEFDRPTPLQIDGETILGVTRYQVKAQASTISTSEKEAATV